MISASLALALALRTALAPLDTALVASTVATHEAQSVSDSQAQPAHFDPTRFDSSTAIALRAILDTALAHRIPTKPIVNQALMGVAYRSSSSAIIKSVRSYYAAMLDARAALGDQSDEGELASGADALRSGIDGKTLEAIRVARPTPGSAVTALIIVADLVKQRGISNNKARDAVIALCRSSRSDDPLNALQQLVAKNAERGPGMAQQALERYLKANAPGTASPATSKPVTRPPGPPDVL